MPSLCGIATSYGNVWALTRGLTRQWPSDSWPSDSREVSDDRYLVGIPPLPRLRCAPVEIRDLEPDDIDAALDARTRSFGPISPEQRESWREKTLRTIAERRMVACYDGTRLVATARINRFNQWWHGRSLPMAGVGGVVVIPEYRGQGVGRRLMHGVLQRATELGDSISALYPATVRLYRRCGWELAGAQYLVTVPAAALRELGRVTVPVRRVGPDDIDDILAVVRRIHTAARSSGPIDWHADEARHWLADDRPFAYLAPDGFLAYRWEGQDFFVDELVAGSGETARALWALVGSGSSFVETVRASVGPADPLRWLLKENVVRPYDERRWMFRVVRLVDALTERGYPASVDTELTFTVTDEQCPENTGTWRLSVTKGVGRVERGSPEEPGLRLDARGLAALYAGTPVRVLRDAGIADAGDPEADDAFDAVFAAQPYLLDYF
mgnify:CR=1 FL=1